MRNLSSNSKIPAGSKSPAKITITYFIISALWILFSDLIVRQLVSDPDSIMLISMMKGWSFIVVSSALIFYLVRRELHRIEILNNELNESNRIFAAFTDSTHEKIWSSDLSGRFTYVNEAACQMFGLKPEDILGKSFLEFTAPESIEISNNALASIYENDRLNLLEHTVVGVTGTKTDLLTNAVLLRNLYGEPYAIMGTSLDITEKKAAEKRMRESEERYRKLVETSHGVIWSVDRSGVITFVNGASRNIFGFEPDEMIGKKFPDFISEEEKKQAIHSNALTSTTGGEILDYETEIITKDGRAIDVLSNSTDLKDGNGNVIGRTGTLIDITERKRVQEITEASEEKYRNLVETSHGIVWTIDAKSKITFISEGCYDITGYRPDELIGKKFKFSDRKQYIAFFREMINARKTGNKGQFENVFRHKLSGKQLNFFNHVVFKYDERGKLESMVGNSVDVTELKEQQDIISRSEQKYRNLVEASQGLIWTINKDGVIEFINKNAVEFYGIEAHDLIGRNFVDFFTPSNKMKMLEDFSGLLGSKDLNNYTSEYELLHPDGKTVNVISSGVLLRDKEGNVTGITGTSIDITERKEAEEALRKSEEKYHVIFESTGTATMIVEEDTTISLANYECTILTGYNPGELIGRKWTEFVAPECLEDMMKNHLLSCSNPVMAPSKYEVKLIDRNGETRNAMLNIGTIRETKQSIVSIVDVTELELANKALRESEEKYRTLTEASQGLIWIIDEEGRFSYISSSAKDYYGIEAENMIGRKAFDFHNPESVEQAEENLRRMFSTGGSTNELQEDVINRPDGRTVYLIERSVAVKNSEGKVIGLMGTSLDITEHKLAEKALKEYSEQIELLYETAQKLNLTLDIAQICRTIFESLRKIVPADSLVLSSYDDVNKLITIRGYMIENTDLDVSIIPPIPLGEGVQSKVILTGEAEVVNDYQQRIRKNKNTYYILESGELTENKPEETDAIKSAIVVPLKVSGKVTGVIQLFSLKENSYNEQQLRFVESLSNYVSVAQQNAILFEEIKEELIERKQAEDALRKSEDKYRTIVETSSEGIWSMDETGKVVFANQKAAQMLGFDLSGMLGKNLLEFVFEEDHELVRGNLEKRKRGVSGNFEFQYRKKDGSPTWAFVSVSPLFDASGKYSGSLSMMTDINDWKLAQVALKESEYFFRESQRAANIGSYKMDFVTGKWESSEVLDEIFGIDKDYDKSVSGWLKIIHPDDRDMMNDYLNNEVIAERKIFDKEYRITRIRDKQIRWLYGLGEVEFDDEGNNFTLTGTIQDITERKKMQNVLEESEEKYRTLVETTPFGIRMYDLDMNIVFANRASLQMQGFESLKEARLFKAADLVPSESKSEVYKYFSEIIRKGFVQSGEMTYLRKDGSTFIGEFSGAALRDSSGSISNVLTVMQDVTERKELEKKLKQSEEYYRTLVETSPFAIGVTNLEGIIVFGNNKLAEMHGYKNMEEFPDGTRMFDLISESNREFGRNNYNENIKSGSIEQLELTLTRKDGCEFPAELTTSVLKDGSGNPTAMLAVIQDITERKRIENLLKESELYYRTLVETSPFAIGVTDMEGRILFGNKKAAEMHGFEDVDKIAPGLTLFDFIAPDERDKAMAYFEENLKTGSIVSKELNFVKKDGSKFPVEISASVLTDSSKKPTAIMSIIQDITDRKRIEDLLKESELYYRTLTDTLPVGIVLLDLNGEATYYSEPVKQMLHFPGGFVALGQNYLERVAPEHRGAAVERMIKVITTGDFSNTMFDYELLRFDGTTFWANTNTAPYTDVNGNLVGVLVVIQDITEKRRMKEELFENKEKLSAVLSAAMDTIIVTDESMRILFFNTAAESLLKCSYAYALGKNIDEFIPKILLEPEVRGSGISRKTQDINAGSSYSFEWVARAMDGTEIPVEASFSTADIMGKEFYTVIIRDITERLKSENEIKKANENLRSLAAHLQKIREEERMLIARDIHDQLGQDLTALKMDIVMLSKDIGKKDKFPDQQSVIGELKGMAELADKTIKWVRKLSTELRPDVLDRLGLFEAIEWQAAEFEKRTGIKCMVNIMGDDSLLSKEQSIVLFRILQESLTNVMRHSGAGKVKISFKEKREGYSFSIEDNGIGFAAGNMEGKGSLGLIGMKERAYTLGGSVDIVSVPGNGTSVNVTIPKTNQNSNG